MVSGSIAVFSKCSRDPPKLKVSSGKAILKSRLALHMVVSIAITVSLICEPVRDENRYVVSRKGFIFLNLRQALVYRYQHFFILKR